MKKRNLLILILLLISACNKDSCIINKGNNKRNQSNKQNTPDGPGPAGQVNTGNKPNNQASNKPEQGNTGNKPNIQISNKPKQGNTGDKPNNQASSKPEEQANEEQNLENIIANDEKIIEKIINAKESKSIKESLEEYKKLHGSNPKVAFTKLFHGNGKTIISNIIKPKSNTAEEIKENIEFIIREGFLGDENLFNTSLSRDGQKTSDVDFFYSPFFDALFDFEVIGENEISKKFNQLSSMIIEKNIYLTSSNKDALRYLLVDKKLDELIAATFANENIPVFIENLIKFADGIDNFNSVIKDVNSVNINNNKYKPNIIYDLLSKDTNNQIAYTLMKKNIKFMDYFEHTDEKDFKTFNDTFKNNSDNVKNLLIARKETRERYLEHHYISEGSKNIKLPTDIKNCINFILDDKNKETVENKFYKVRDIVRDFASTNKGQLDSGFFEDIRNKLMQNKQGHFNNKNDVQEFLGFSNNTVGVAAPYTLEDNPKSYHL